MKQTSRKAVKVLSVFMTIIMLIMSINQIIAIAAENKPIGENSQDFVIGEPDSLVPAKTVNCEHFCHSQNAILKFIYRIVNFFWRLFSINQFCECGMAHWGLESVNLDKDGNGIPDCVENKDYLTDTDGDGLTDYQEYVYCGTSPLIYDTDNDGLNDADSDSDLDSISNISELRNGTDPLNADSDEDGLNDAEETKYKTDALNSDTDSDGAKDGWEIENGFDPLKFDESFTVSDSLTGQEYPDSTFSVSFDTDNGKITDTLNITEVTSRDNALVSEFVAGYLGAAYDFTVDGEFDIATITFKYDPSLGEIGDDFQPRIYYLNEETGEYEELPNQTVENGKVTAETTHNSTYVLLNKVAFDAVWKDDIKSPIVDAQGNQTGIDVVFTIDVSSSMNSNSRLSNAKSALNSFIDALDKEDRAGLVKFNTSSTVVSDLTSNYSSFKNTVNSISASGNTSMYTGLSSAISLLSKSGDNYGYKVIIILSDGKDVPTTTYESKYQSLVEKANANDITIYTVGTGTSVDASMLTKIANETGGSYYSSVASVGIIDDFGKVKEETVDLTTDSNNDGIPDYFADLIFTGELVLSNGSTELKGIDFNSSDDIDGDGLLNGEEVKLVENGNKVYLKYISSPIEYDTDGDGIYDCSDTAPLKLGLKNGVIGVAKLFADTQNLGHAFITFTSYIDWSTKVSASYYADNINGGVYYNFENKDLVFGKNRYVSFGLLQNGFASSTASKGEESLNGFNINGEVSNGAESYYKERVSISSEITKEELLSIIRYFESKDSYNAVWNNCSEVAAGAWNSAFNTEIPQKMLPVSLSKYLRETGYSVENDSFCATAIAWCCDDCDFTKVL